MARPVPGDKVTPELLLGNTWKPEGPVLLSVRLLVQNDKETAPDRLQLKEIPYECVPRVDVTFFKDKSELSRLDDVPLARDC